MISVAPQLAFFGDDFTGSTDALDFLSRAGMRTMLFTPAPTPERLANFGRLDAVGVAGRTRSLAPDPMERELRQVFTALRSLRPRHVHYKVCSTFDSSPTIGSIGRAIDVGAEIFPGKFVPLLVAAPALGRYCVFGNLFAKMGTGGTGEVYRLDRHPSMSRHPVTPADEGDLRRHLAKQTTKRIALFDILKQELDGAAAQSALAALVAGGAEIVLFDALTNAHLAPIGALIDAQVSAGQPLFSVGSSGIEMALGAHWKTQGKFKGETKWAEPAARPLLVISGSCSPVTAQQIEWAVAHGFADVGVDAAQLAMVGRSAVESALAAARSHLKAGRNVVVYTSRGESDPAVLALSAGERTTLATRLGELARDLVTEVGGRRVLIAGGDTSGHIAHALGIDALEMIAPLTPGAPLCRAHSAIPAIEGLEVNFKGGQVGGEDYFAAVARGRL